MNAKLFRLIALIALLTVVLSGCNSFLDIDLLGRSVRGSGTSAEEKRNVSDFDSVSLNTIGILEITTGDSDSLTIEADDNILPYITTEVRNGRLIIDDERGYNLRPDVPIRYHLTIAGTGLERLSVAGSGEIHADELSQPELNVDISGSGYLSIDQLEGERLIAKVSGSGDFDLTGQVDEQSIDVSGSGEFDGADLQSERADVSISGSGDVTVWAEEALDVDISGSGSVSYYGSPDINQRTSGSGEINNLGDR